MEIHMCRPFTFTFWLSIDAVFLEAPFPWQMPITLQEVLLSSSKAVRGLPCAYPVLGLSLDPLETFHNVSQLIRRIFSIPRGMADDE
jgi:hypothetical protein